MWSKSMRRDASECARRDLNVSRQADDECCGGCYTDGLSRIIYGDCLMEYTNQMH